MIGLDSFINRVIGSQGCSFSLSLATSRVGDKRPFEKRTLNGREKKGKEIWTHSLPKTTISNESISRYESDLDCRVTQRCVQSILKQGNARETEAGNESETCMLYVLKTLDIGRAMRKVAFYWREFMTSLDE